MGKQLDKKQNNGRKRFIKFINENKKLILSFEIFAFILFVALSVIGQIYQWHSVAIAIFDSFFTASFISAVTLIITWNTQNEYDKTIEEISAVTDDNKEVLDSAITAINSTAKNLKSSLEVYFGHNCLFCRTSLVAVYDNREEAHLREFFEKATKNIGILTTNLASIVNDDRIMETLINKAKNGLSVKISTMDVSTSKEFINIRAKCLQRTPSQFVSKIKESLIELMLKNYTLFEGITDFKNQPHNLENSIQIKTYSVPSSLIMFISDDEYIIGFILNETSSRNVIHFHLKDEGEESKVSCFANHFNSVFNSGNSITEKIVESWSL